MAKWTIFEFQKGLLYDGGKFIRELDAGHYKFWPWSKKTIQVVDMRETSQTIEGQEILTSDKIGIRVTLIAQYKIADAAVATHTVENYFSQLYQDLQLTLREAVTSKNARRTNARSRIAGRRDSESGRSSCGEVWRRVKTGWSQRHRAPRGSEVGIFLPRWKQTCKEKRAWLRPGMRSLQREHEQTPQNCSQKIQTLREFKNWKC